MQHRVINKNLSYESPPGPPLYTNNTKFVKRLKQLNFSKSCPNLLDHHAASLQRHQLSALRYCDSQNPP